MASMMDVDPPSRETAATSETGAGGGSQQEKILKVHPLAIIGISDHHTRVVTGGSALPTTAPVMGLLFGYQDGLTVSIIDAEEMEYSFSEEGKSGGGAFGGGTDDQQAQHKSGIQTKIDLHRKVFPMHEVIGWYRVSNDPDGSPTEEDLRMNNGKMREYNESPLFVLMNAGSQEALSSEKSSGGKEGSSKGDAAREKLERDEQLPLSVYETLVTVNTNEDEAQPRAVFVNLEFELETFEPERIAVEKVFKTQPSMVAVAASSATVSKTATSEKDSGNSGAKGEKGDEPSAAPNAATIPPSGLDMHLQSIQSSIQAMNTRLAILIDFLKKTQKGEVPTNHKLLRQVDSLVRQLPFVMSSSNSRLSQELDGEYDDMLMLSYLASVTKAAKAVRGYTEKFGLVHETNTRDVMRRGY